MCLRPDGIIMVLQIMNTRSGPEGKGNEEKGRRRTRRRKRKGEEGGEGGGVGERGVKD